MQTRPICWNWNWGILVPNRWTIMEQEIYILLSWLTINSIHNTNFIKQSWNSVQNGFQSTRTKLSKATHYTLSRSTNVSEWILRIAKGRAIARYFKLVWPKCTSGCSIWGGLGVFSPRKILLILDAKRSLLMQFSSPKSYILQFLPNRIWIFAATRTLCEAADCG